MSAATTVRSQEPERRTVVEVGCQASEQTLSVWWVYDLAHVVVVRSHSFTVVSADAEARRFRCDRFAARARMESM